MLSEDVIYFLRQQNFAIVTTIDSRGRPHSACKGIVKMEPEGKVYLLDLYKRETYKNLKQNPKIAITSVDEHKFRGYCLKGKARIAGPDELGPEVISGWESKLASRITQRVINSIQGRKGHRHHPEALLPAPQYLILMQTEEVVNLTPEHINLATSKQ